MLIEETALLKNPPEASHFKPATIPLLAVTSGALLDLGLPSLLAATPAMLPLTHTGLPPVPVTQHGLLSWGTATRHSFYLERFYPGLCMAAAFPH